MKSILLLALALVCCPAFSAPPMTSEKVNPVHFAVQKIKVGDKELSVEIAENDEQRSRGLMFRTSLENGKGMLFIFGSEQRLSFWMKNTFIPLSIGYFDKNKTLVDIQEMKPVVSQIERPSVYPSARPAQYALEVPPKWFEKNKIKVGSKFEFVK